MLLYLTALDTYLSLALHEISCDVLNNVGIDLIPIVEAYEFCLLQCIIVGDWKGLKEPFIAEELRAFTFIVNEFGKGEASAFNHLCLVFYLDVPLLPLAHLEQFVDHLGDTFHLLVWRLFD